MNLLITLICYFTVLFEYTLQQENCIGYSPTAKNCYECTFSYYHSPNMTSDNLLYPSNCTPRKNESLSLRYYISTKKCASAALCNGTEQYPFDEINRAFWVAHTQANERNYTEVEFYFLGSPHYVLRKNLPQVNFGYFRRINMTVSMAPCLCAFKNISGCVGPEESTLVYIKTDSFNIYVANRVIIKNMIFNGTDMHLLTASTLNDVNNCYNKEQICCNFSSRNTIFVSSSKTACALVKRVSTATPTETWKNRTSFLNVEPILDDPSRKNPELLLENITFCDIYTGKSVNGWLGLVLMGSNCLGRLNMKNITILDVQLIKGILLAATLEEIIPSATDFSSIWSLKPFESNSIDLISLNFISYNKFNIDMNKIFPRDELGVISLFNYQGKFTFANSLCHSFIFSDFFISLLHFENCFMIFFDNVTISNFRYVMLMNLLNSSMTINQSKFINVSTMEGLFLNRAANLTLSNSSVLYFEGLIQSSALFLKAQNSHLELLNFSVAESLYFSSLMDSSDVFLFNISINSTSFVRQLVSLTNSLFLADQLSFINLNINNVDFIFYLSSYPLPCYLSNIIISNITLSGDSLVSFFRWAGGTLGIQLIWANFSIIESDMKQLLLAENLDQFLSKASHYIT